MKRKFTCILVVGIMTLTLLLCGALTGCGKKPSAEGGIQVSVSGGTFANKKSISKFDAGKTVKITAVEKLGQDGKPDRFVKWTDEEGNTLSTDAKFSYTVPDKKEGVTIYGEWEWYGKAAPNVRDNDKVVAYIENNKTAGTYDSVVEAAIEKKFKDDTGYSIDLVIEAGSTSTLGTKVSGELAAGNQIDLMVNHWGSDSPIDGYLKGDMSQKLDYLLENAVNYRTEYYKYDPYKSAYYTGVYNGELKGVSGIDVNSKWALLMNGTMLDSLYGMAQASRIEKYINMFNEAFPADEFDDPEHLSKYFDIANDDYKNMKISQFTAVLELSKALIGTIERPLNASGWSVDYTITPVFGGTSYGGYEYDAANDRIVPSYSTAGYIALLEYEKMLQDKKLWYENPNSSDGNDFYARKNIVMVSWPDNISLITQSRMMKSSNGDDCIVLAPLATDEGVVNGFAAQSTAFSGMVVFRNSTQLDLITRYIDWEFTKDADGNYTNYELCEYGVLGEHWVKTVGEDGVTTWDYPEEKKAAFKDNDPYSGRFLLLGNAYISNYMWSDYNDVERARYQKVSGFKCWFGPTQVYKDGNIYGGTKPGVMSGFNMPKLADTQTDLVKANKDLGDEYQNIRGLAWSAKEIPDGSSITKLSAAMVGRFDNTYRDLITWWTDEFNKFVEMRANTPRIGEE